MTVDLTGRVALVTGGNRGIGFEVCRSLGHAGAKVILGSRDETKGEASAAQLRSEGLDVVCRQFDVQSNASVEALAAWLEGEHGKLDVLVNNAGILPTSKGLLETTLDEVDAMWQVNTMGPWRVTLALLPLMQRNHWGRIVNVSSEAGSMQRTASWAPAYSISKTALNAFTKTMASELRSDGILLNAVCPGWVHSDMGGPGAPRSLEQGAASVMWAVQLDDDGPAGGFFRDGQPLPW